MKRYITLNEFIEELQKNVDKYGNNEIFCIGKCSNGDCAIGLKGKKNDFTDAECIRFTGTKNR